MKRRQKTEMMKQNSDNKKKLTKTEFENLSNELIYEIFDYFDYFYIYEIFSKLNSRFQSLFINSSVPLKLNLSFISKSTLKNHYKSILDANINEIISLRISKYFLDYFPLNLFTSLQCLNIEKIPSDKILFIIDDLNSLENFSLLTIQTSNYFQDENSIYLGIFRLKKIKYCKLTFPSGGERVQLPLALNQCLTLERLILDGHCRLDQLISILSYVPKLKHLTCECLCGSDHVDIIKIPENLLSISLKLHRISFNPLKMFLSKVSSKLKVLKIQQFNDESFFHAEQWEELIVNSMPCLKSFDLQYSTFVDDDFQEDLIKKFNSTFWIERQWFFDYYYYYKLDDLDYLQFFSRVPYRSNDFVLYAPVNHDVCKSFRNNSINYAQHLTIENHFRVDKYSIQFPRVTKLTLTSTVIDANPSFFNDINLLVPLIHITDLNIKYNRVSIAQLIKILCLLPNLESLSLSHTSIFQSRSNVTMNSLPTNNKIAKLFIDEDDEYELKHIQFLNRLFPRLEYLEISMNQNNIETILRYLLSKSKFLFSLFLSNVTNEIIKDVQTLIHTENLIHDYTIEHVQGGLYLWW